MKLHARADSVQYVTSSRPCMFCWRTDSPLTKEHVYPHHWRKFFPDVGGPDNVWQSGPRGFVERRGANHQFDNQVRDICAACNSGWMRQLDERVRPFVIPMAHGVLTSLDRSQTNAFRTWATKTALVRTLQDRSQQQQAHDDRFREFFANRRPFGELVVQAAACDYCHVDNNTSWVVPGEPSATSNTVTFAIGRLFAQVASSIRVITSTGH